MRELPPKPGDMIRARLAELAWSRRDLAEVLDAKLITVQQRINGAMRFRAKDAVAYAAALSIDPLAILHAQAAHDLSYQRGRPRIRERAKAMAEKSAERARAMVRACESLCAPEAEAAE